MRDPGDVPAPPPGLGRLFAAERDAPAPSPEALERIFERLQGSLQAPAPASTPAPSSAASAAAGKRAALTVALAFGAGLGGGAALHATFAPPRVERVVVEVPRAPEPATPPPAAEAPPTPEAPRAIAGPEPEAPREPKPRHRPDDAIAREELLLERARAAMVRNHGDEALAALAQHAREFPQGRLAEERDALEVQAQRAAGHVDEATRAAARFRERYPHSIFLPIVSGADAR